jgi:hypothetical protein
MHKRIVTENDEHTALVKHAKLTQQILTSNKSEKEAHAFIFFLFCLSAHVVPKV